MVITCGLFVLTASGLLRDGRMAVASGLRARCRMAEPDNGRYSGVLPSLLSEQFPVETRAIGVSLGFSTAVSIFGGFAPFIAQTGNPLSPSYYLNFTALLSLVALIAIQRRSRPG